MRGFLDELGESLKSGLTRARFEADKTLRVNRARQEVATAESEWKSKLEDMGYQALQLVESGEITDPSLVELSKVLRDLRTRLNAKESELASIQVQTFEQVEAGEVAPEAAATEGAKFCPACGSQVSASDVFCANCGNKLQ